MSLLLLHSNNTVVCFHYHLDFLRCLQRLQAQLQTFCTPEKTNFSLNKKMHINVEKIASLSTKRCQLRAT